MLDSAPYLSLNLTLDHDDLFNKPKKTGTAIIGCSSFLSYRFRLQL